MASQLYVIIEQDGDEGIFAPTTYDRVVTRVTVELPAVNPGASANFELLIDDVTTGITVTVANGAQVAAQAVDIAVDDGETLSVSLSQAGGGVLNAAVWIEFTQTPDITDTAWYSPTADEVKAAVSSSEYEQFTLAYMQTGQLDPIPQIINATVNQIREAIRSGRRNNLGQAGTIPPEAALTFRYLAKWQLFSRLTTLPDSQKQAEFSMTQAQNFLTAVRDGKVEFVKPSTVTEYVPSGAYGTETPLNIDTTSPVMIADDDLP